MLDKTDFISLAIETINGLKTSKEAIMASGMQLELAAHLMLQCSSLQKSIILRAGIPPVYNQKRGPKSGLNLSKTSLQGLFKGSIPLDLRFTRLNNGVALGHHKTDASRLLLDLRHPEYQHSIQLTLTMQDILRELSPKGDLRVLGYEDGKLRLCYKAGRGHPDFYGQFIINLLESDSPPVFYSRPWDKPEHHTDWDPVNHLIRKPDALSLLPEEVYQQCFSNLFSLSYAKHQDILLHPDEVEEARVFANTPKTSRDLLQAIKETKALALDLQVLRNLEAMDDNTPMYDVLDKLSLEQIKTLYDTCGLITTGDWDGLLLGHPNACELSELPPTIGRVYNTFMKGVSGINERQEFLDACCDYVHFLKTSKTHAETPIGKLVRSIENPGLFFTELAIKRAGSITPYEFVFTQLINYAYQDKENKAYGETISLEDLQSSLEAGLKHKNTPKEADQEDDRAALDICLHYYQKRTERKYVPEAIKTHLAAHLEIAQANAGKPCKIPHPDYDHNVHELFQHGFEIRNPYGARLDGAWFMITDQGGMLYGETQDQLIGTLLLGDFLEKNSIDIPACVAMTDGWWEVLEKQMKLGQSILPKTLENYQSWLLTQRLQMPTPPLFKVDPTMPSSSNSIVRFFVSAAKQLPGGEKALSYLMP